MLNKETEYTYVTSKDADVENGNFGKNVGVDIVTEKMSIRHGGLDEGGASSVLDDLIEGKSGIHLVSNAESVSDAAFARFEQDGIKIGLGWYLESVDLPNATSIGENAFVSCSALTSVDLPNATSIGDGAFGGCSALTSVDLPNATSIGAAAFGGISSTAVINLGAAEGEISGAPWGAPEGVTINYGVKEV